MIVVVDASVALKWFLSFKADEHHTDLALDILDKAGRGLITLVQPPHFIAEVAAVLARLKPLKAQDDLFDLLNIERSTLESPEVHATALDLAIRHQQDVFDTLYHAVALHTADATLVTADRRYFDKARHLGQIAWLADFQAA